MDKDCIVAFDSGTQSVKTIVFDKSGRILGEGYHPLTVCVPEPMKAEQDQNEWWEAFRNSLFNALNDSRVSQERIAAVGITSQRETMCAIDSQGNPVLPAQVWYDARAVEQVRWIRNEFGAEEYMKITGRTPDTTWWLSKIMWVMDNEKEVFENVYKFMTVHGFFVYKLTGELKDSYASPTGLLDMSKFEYSQDLLDFFRIPRDKLCDLVSPGTIIGAVSEEASKQTGLNVGTPVAAGAGDQQAGGLGAGLIDPRGAYLNLGTSVVFGILSSQYKYHQNFFVREGCIPQTWNFEALINGGYWMVTWYKQNFGQPEVHAADSLGLSAEEILDLEARKIRPGSFGLIVQPYWLGARQPYWDENARGTIIGWNNTHTRVHLYRAIIEGIAYEIRLNLDGFEDALKIAIDDIRVFGGGAKSGFSCQIISDVLNKSISQVGTPEATTLGAAILAASATDLYSNIKEAARSMTSISKKFEPKKEDAKVYNDYYKKVYRRLYPTLQPLVKEL